jgi:hypothetical protein
MVRTRQRITKPPGVAKDEIGRGAAASMQAGYPWRHIGLRRLHRSGNRDPVTLSRHEPSAKKTDLPTRLGRPRFYER